MGKRVTPSDRLKEAIEYSRRRRQRKYDPLAQLMGLTPDKTEKPDFSNLETFIQIAPFALRINPAAADYELLIKAFTEFGLDIQDPYDWRDILWYFAHAHFGVRKKAGRKKSWDSARWSDLLADFADKKVEKPQASDSDICRFIKKDAKLSPRYARISEETIRRNLIYARDPMKNSFLKHFIDEVQSLVGTARITAALDGRADLDQEQWSRRVLEIATAETAEFARRARMS